jgi:hypothetical protein
VIPAAMAMAGRTLGVLVSLSISEGFTGGREMVTMKMELLVRDPRRLLREDPDLFDLLVTELRGA